MVDTGASTTGDGSTDQTSAAAPERPRGQRCVVLPRSENQQRKDTLSERQLALTRDRGLSGETSNSSKRLRSVWLFPPIWELQSRRPDLLTLWQTRHFSPVCRSARKARD